MQRGIEDDKEIFGETILGYFVSYPWKENPLKRIYQTQNFRINSGGANICVGSNFFMGKDFRLYAQPDAKIIIGDDCGFMDRVCISAGEAIIIGDRVLGGSNILITDNDHGTVCYANQQIICSPTSIGDECWIGEGTCILRGVHVGKKCMIGAGSVVTRDIPSYSIAVGNPAKAVKKWDFGVGEWVKC